MVYDVIFDELNPEQLRAVEAVEGPVCILAGAGSGKTTTITRRLANQVTSGAFAPDSLLAVTFTRKAADEMRSRLARLGVEGVRAMTFHAAALSQLTSFRPGSVGGVLSSKAEILVPLARSLPPPHKFTPVADLAAEIEWAKNQRITPDRYKRALGEHLPPIPEDHMARIFASYENQKSARNVMDFEDILGATIQMFESDETARAGFRARIKAITVDEYQDVNLLQQSLLDLWLGERDELCAVGDDYQAIYSFTGATPDFLLEMPSRFPDAHVVKLERSYRSTPQVLDVANRLVPELKGAKKVLVTDNEDGPEPVLKGFFDSDRETRFVIEQVAELHGDGISYEDIAIFYRTNAKSEIYEDALTEASIPFQVRDLGAIEPGAKRRPRRTRDAVGVNLLTLHSAKGLEFEAVFVPALEEGEIPYRRATESSLPEERRLLYVGITRAKKHLHVSWSIKKPSRFVTEIKPKAPKESA
ncbi:MAG: ATP-dependent helicase [Actinomycetota bacterium]